MLSCLTNESNAPAKRRCKIIVAVVIAMSVLLVTFLVATLLGASSEIPLKEASSRDENLDLKLVHVVSDLWEIK